MNDPSLQACLDGDKHAWDSFVDRYAPVIYAAVRRVAGSTHDAADVEDVVQDVFLRLVRRDFHLLRTFDPARASLPTWLTLVARSVAIDAVRRRRTDAVCLEGLDPAVEPANPAEGDPIELPLNLLTTRQRLVLRMLFEQDLSVLEAARLIGVDEQTIRSTKHKALSRLRDHFSSSPPRRICDDPPEERG